MTGDKLIAYWDDCGNRGEKCSLDGVFIVSPCWSPDVVISIHKIFIASGALLQLTSTCLQCRIVLFGVFLPRNFVITNLKLIIFSWFCFSYCDFLPHFLVCETFVLSSLFPFHRSYFEYSRLAEWLESPSAERQRVSLLWQQESELFKYPWALNPYTSSWDSGV